MERYHCKGHRMSDSDVCLCPAPLRLADLVACKPRLLCPPFGRATDAGGVLGALSLSRSMSFSLGAATFNHRAMIPAPQEVFLQSCVKQPGTLMRLLQALFFRALFGFLGHRCFFFQSSPRPGEAYNVVALGAGFDTGALRRPWPEELRYFEVDFPAAAGRSGVMPSWSLSKPMVPFWGRWLGCLLDQSPVV